MTQPARIALATSTAYDDPEVLMVAAALGRGGFRAEVVNWDDERDWSSYDLVAIRSTWDYFDRLEEFLRWVDAVDAQSRIVNSPNVIRWNSHKGYLRELADRGVNVMPTLVIPAGVPDAAQRLAACGWDEVVVKPAVDGGARYALRGRAGEAEAQRHAETLSGAGDVIVQPFAPEVAEGEVSLLFFGGEFSHAMRKVPATGDFRVHAHLGGSEVAHEPTAAELATAQAAMACAPGTLAYARIDLVAMGGVPTLMELELIEPDLYFRADPAGIDRYVSVLASLLG